MKILHIIPSLHGGGAEKFCIDLSNELSKDNEVIICSLFDVTKDMFMTEKILPSVKVITLNKKLGFDPTVFFKIYKITKQENPDIVNTHLRALFYSIFLILFSKYKIFHTVHNIAQKETSGLKQKFYNVFFNYFGVKPIAISKVVLNSIKQRYGKKFNILIANGIKQCELTSKNQNVLNEIKTLKPTVNTKVFITIGRLVLQKNHHMLIHAINKLIKGGEDVLLLIIGDSPVSENSTEIQLKKYESDRVIFLGLKENVCDYLFYSDAFCLSSLYEGLPITLLEAMSLGVIPICTPAGGIIDVVNPNIGFLSKGFDEDSYYSEIKKFLSSEENLLSQMKENIKREFSLKYDISMTADKYVSAYEGKY